VFVNRVPQPERSPFSEGAVDPGSVFREQGYLTVRRTYKPSLWDIPDNPSAFSNFPNSVFQTHTDLYALYNTITNNHSDYISVESIGVDGLGNQIREYTCRPPEHSTRDWSSADVALPKIVIQGGIHGSERVQFLTLLQLFDALASEWDQHPLLEKLRWGCELVFIPQINPSGTDLRSRKNHNGVDLNRNANFNWSSGGSTDPTSSNYRGPIPASEAETQVMQGLPLRHPTACAFIDFHNHTTPSNTGFANWLGANRESELGVALETLGDMQMYLERDFPSFNSAGQGLTRMTKSANKTIAGYWANVRSAPSYLHETPRWWDEIPTLDLLRYNMRATVGLIYNIWRREMQKRRVERVI
jgi:hypothetical protein